MRAIVALAGLCILLCAGCSESPSHKLPTGPVAGQAPDGSSPEQVLRTLEWSWEHRDSIRYSRLIAPGFRFVFSQLDPNGEPYRDDPWTREDDVISAGHLFHGGSANQPAAASISLDLDRNFLVSEDPRFPDSDARVRIRTSLSLVLVDVNQAQSVVQGFGVFYLVRGDSAAFSDDLVRQGFVADSTRWYVERWEDGTHSGGLRQLPAKALSMGEIKAVYR